MVRENQIVVVVGETGSGKTTQLTQVRLDFFFFFFLNYFLKSKLESLEIFVQSLTLCL